MFIYIYICIYAYIIYIHMHSNGNVADIVIFIHMLGASSPQTLFFGRFLGD